MEKSELIEFLRASLKQAGFVRKGMTWYLNEEKIIKVVNLQKSSYGNSYYLNVSVYIKALGNDEFPKEQECHIRTRLDNSLVNVSKNYSFLFDLGNLNMSPDAYKNEIEECVHEVVLPQLDSIKSKENILQIAEKKPVFLNLLPIKVKEYFEIK